LNQERTHRTIKAVLKTHTHTRKNKQKNRKTDRRNAIDNNIRCCSVWFRVLDYKPGCPSVFERFLNIIVSYHIVRSEIFGLSLGDSVPGKPGCPVLNLWYVDVQVG